MNIQPVQATELEMLATFARQTFYDAYIVKSDPKNMETYLAEAFNMDKIKTEFANPKVRFFFAFVNEKLVGFVKLRWDRNDEELEKYNALELQRIYIDKPYWGQKMGSQLLDFTFQFAKEKGFNCIWLLLYRENEKALRFYQKHGMEVFGERYFTFGEVMELDYVLKKEL